MEGLEVVVLPLRAWHVPIAGCHIIAPSNRKLNGANQDSDCLATVLCPFRSAL